MKLLHFTYLMAVSVIFITCRQEKVKPVAETPAYCEILPNEPPIGWQFAHTFPMYFQAVYNPNDPNEIAYIANDTTIGHYRKLYKVNLQTGVKKLLVDTVFEGLSYSTKNWLAFTRYGGIWIIKDNGDSLTQLTSGGGNSPAWSPNGNTLFFSRTVPTGSLALLTDRQGNVDTIRNADIVTGDWSPDGSKIIGNTNSDIIFITIPGKKVSKIPVDPSNSVHRLRWLSNDEFIYFDRRGLNNYSLVTQSSRLLIPSCETVTYMNPSTTPGRRAILLCKKVIHYVSGRTLEDPYFIIEVNPDTRSVSTINIP